MRVFIIASMLAAFVATGCQKKSDTSEKLTILCGASMRTPVNALVEKLREQNPGIDVVLDYGGSETLLPRVLVGTDADVYVCHDPFGEKVSEAGRTEENYTAGELYPVVAIHKDKDLSIKTLDDLAQPNLKLANGDPQYSTCGKIFLDYIQDKPQNDAIRKNIIMQGRGHGEMAGGVKVGSLDAVITWNFVVPLYGEDLVRTPLDIPVEATAVSIILLKDGSGSSALRSKWMTLCKSPEGKQVFIDLGYTK